jgi:hypothetical protein
MNYLRAECVESSSDRILGHEVRMFESEPPEVTGISNQFHCIFKANFRRIPRSILGTAASETYFRRVHV